MAIKIPSKNIYEMNNPKIRDNVIDNVSVKNKVVTLLQENNTNIANFEHQTGFVAREKKSKYAQEEHPLDGYTTRSFVSLQTFYYDSELSFPKLLKNGYIKEVYEKLNAQNKNNITYELSYKIITTKYKGSNVNNSGLIDGNIISEEVTNGYGEIPNREVNAIEEFRNSGISENFQGNDTVSLSETNETNLSKLSIVYDEENDTYNFNPIILCGLKKEWAYYYYYNNVITGETRSFAYGGETYYMPKQVSININGDVVSLNIEDSSTTLGSGNKPHSLSGNELLQDSSAVWKNEKSKFTCFGLGNTLPSFQQYRLIPKDKELNDFHTGQELLYKDEILTVLAIMSSHILVSVAKDSKFLQEVQYGDVIELSYLSNPENLTKYLADNVLSQYEKGKETATLLCDISDYYNENGEKVIDIKTNKMSFRLHDEVIPYVFGANGQDNPMSKYQDGTAKVFEVVGSNIIYDGAVWQELTLLEKKQ